MTNNENPYLQIFNKWIERLDKSKIKIVSLRGSFDEGWFDVEFELGNYSIYILLNSDVVQVYDRYARKINEVGKLLQATDSVADFTPAQFQTDLESLYEFAQSDKIESYFLSS